LPTPAENTQNQFFTPLRNPVISEYQTSKRKYTHIDCPGHQNNVKTVITASQNMDAAILVVSALEGIMPQTREHMKICKQFGVQYVVVYLNMIDLVKNDDVIIDLAELEIQHFLTKLGYDPKTLFIIKGSALEALKGSASLTGEESIRKVLEVLDTRAGQSEPSSINKNMKFSVSQSTYITVFFLIFHYYKREKDF